MDEKRKIGSSLKVTPIGLGCMGFSHAYGAPTERKEAVRMIRRAYEMGYDFFDTAECYTGVNTDGTISYNEELVGEALRDVRERVTIATKFGVQHSPKGLLMDSRPETIRKSVEGSLKRLGVETIDLYYQHRIDPKIEPETVAEVMKELIVEGTKIRLMIDISMTVLLPFLMAYSLIGEAFHEVVGTAIFVLFIVHHLLNRRWYGALFKGKYNARRIFQTVLNMLLLFVMILQPVSGILMSKHLYTFLPTLPISAQARSIHMLLAYWDYVLMCIHAGTHLTAPLGKLARKGKKTSMILYVILGCISIYGCVAFAQRGFPGYMSGKTTFAFFDFGEQIILFLLDYLAIMALFMIIGFLTVYALSRLRKTRKAVKR